MRVIFALPLLALAACSVQNGNGQTTVELNGQSLDNAASDVGNAAEGAASEVANVASSAGETIENSVDNMHVDVDVGHDRTGNSH